MSTKKSVETETTTPPAIPPFCEGCTHACKEHLNPANFYADAYENLIAKWNPYRAFCWKRGEDSFKN